MIKIYSQRYSLTNDPIYPYIWLIKAKISENSV